MMMAGIYRLVQLGAKAAQDEIEKAANAQQAFKTELAKRPHEVNDILEEGFGAEIDIHMQRAAEWQNAVNEALTAQVQA